MNQQILKKQLGLKSTIKLRDYYSARFDEDRPDFLKEKLEEFIDAEKGDIIWILSFKPNKKYKRGSAKESKSIQRKKALISADYRR